jgi:spastin
VIEIVMVRKTKASSCPSSDNKEGSSNNETEKKTLIFLSFPIVMIFNLLKTILFELFIVLKFVYNTSSRILSKPQEADVNLETVKAEELKESMDLLQMQKNHHKKAFEYISQALKIDETQNPGENSNLSSVGVSMNSV